MIEADEADGRSKWGGWTERIDGTKRSTTDRDKQKRAKERWKLINKLNNQRYKLNENKIVRRASAFKRMRFTRQRTVFLELAAALLELAAAFSRTAAGTARNRSQPVRLTPSLNTQLIRLPLPSAANSNGSNWRKLAKTTKQSLSSYAIRTDSRTDGQTDSWEAIHWPFIGLSQR